MGKLTVTKTKLTDVLIIEPAVFGDHRGFFTESYSQADFQEAGITQNFVQDNHSLSVEAGVLRGLHFEKEVQPMENGKGLFYLKVISDNCWSLKDLLMVS